MPSHYTHLCFGRHVIEAMPEHLRDAVWKHKHCYLAGLQGPDPLFYYRPLVKHNPVRQRGSEIHQESGRAFFSPAMQVLRQEKTPQRASYVAGCICHYMLDTACHPYIEGELARHGIGHLQVETELDSTLLLERGVDLYRPDLVAYLWPGEELTQAAAPFYQGLTEKQVDGSFRAMKKYVPFTRWKNNLLRRSIKGVLSLVGMKQADLGVLVEPTLNPDLAWAVAELRKKMMDEVAPTVEEIQGFFQAVEGKQPLSRRFDASFDGEEVDMRYEIDTVGAQLGTV